MVHSLRVLLVLLLIQLQSSFESTKGSSVDDGEWAMDFSMGDEGECNIEIRDVNSITYTEFIKEYAYTKPVILRGLTDNSNFRFLCSKSNLLKEYGEKTVRLSTANTHSYNKVDVQFEEFVKFLLTPQSEDALGSDTLYFFGDNNFTEWHSLFEEYKAPPYSLPHMSPAYSFGIAGPGTGVPFHWHGPGFSEVIYGRKRWFLYPPRPGTRVPTQPHYFVMGLFFISESGAPSDASGVHHTTRRGTVFSRSLVACNTKPGHQRLYFNFPGLK